MTPFRSTNIGIAGTQDVEMVGRGLRLVERVTGRVTALHAMAAGAASGAWLGLFIGLPVGLFTSGPAWLGLMLGGLVIGALAGAIFTHDR